MSLVDELEEIAGTIYGLTKILEDDGCRDGADGEQAVLGRFEQGVINTAIKQLALRVEGIAKAIDKHGKQRPAYLVDEHGQGGRS